LGPVESKGSAAIYIGFIAGAGAITGPATVTIDGVTKEAEVIGGGLNVDLLTVNAATAGTITQPPAPAFGGELDGALTMPPAPTTTPAPPSVPPVTESQPTGPTTIPENSEDEEANPTTVANADPVPTTPATGPGGPAATDTIPAPPGATPTDATPTDASTPAPSTEVSRPADPSATSDAPATRPAAPAAVALTGPGGAETLTAGATGALSFSATNSGGQRSGPTAFDINLPAGVSVRSVSIDGSTICESRSCQLPTIEPGASVTVVVAVAAEPGAATGGAAATIDGNGVGWMLRVEPASVLPTPTLATAVIPDAVRTEVGHLLPAGN
jgi:hypothetical protein